MPKDTASPPSLTGIELAQAGPGALGEPIGAVETLAGKSFITRVDGTKVQATKGLPVYQGDLVETGKIAQVGITFADDTTFALGSNGEMTLDEMVYDPGTQSGNLAVNVAEGVFSFVSGQIAKTSADAMTISTPVTTIGVRGSSGVGSGGQNGSFGLLRDPTGQHGELTVGTKVDFETLNEPFAATYVDGPFNPPTLSTVLPPSIMQQTFGNIGGAVPGAKPSFTPLAGRTGNAAQNQAALNTFNSTLAAGGSIGDALSRATTNASDVRQVQKWEGIGSGPYAPDNLSQQVTDNILNAKSNDAQGGIGAKDKDPLSAGDGEQDSFGVKGSEVEDAKPATDETKAEVEEETDDLNKDTEDTTKQQAPKDLGEQAENAIEQMNSQIEIGIKQVTKGGGVNIGADEIVGEIINEIADTIEDAFSSAFAETAGGDFFNDAFSQDFFDDGGIDPFAFGFGLDIATGTESFFDPVLQDEFFDFGFTGPPPDLQRQIDEFITETVTEVIIGGGTTDQFNEILNASTNDDNLIGNNTNTQFVMTQGTSLGGTDNVNGQGGTDELTFTNLEDIQMVYDATNAKISYVTGGTTSNTASGSVTLTSIEQMFFGGFNDETVNESGDLDTNSGAAQLNDGGNAVRLAFDNAEDAGKFGYVVGGTPSGETLTTANGTTMSNLSGGTAGKTVTASEVLGSVIFAFGGADTITGSEKEDVIFGGAGNDTINTTAGQDALYGGDGDDLFVVNAQTDLDNGGGILGGAGTDTIQAKNTLTTLDISANTLGVTQIEKVAMANSGTASTLTLDDSKLADGSGSAAAGAIHTLTAGLTGSTLKGGGSTLDLSGVTTLTNFTKLETVNTTSAGNFWITASQSGNITHVTSGGANGSLTLVDGGTFDLSGITYSNISTIAGTSSNDTLKFNIGDLGAGISIDGGGGTDKLQLLDGGTAADAKFSGLSNFDTLVLADAASYVITLGTNAQSAFGSGFTVDASAMTSANAVTLNALGITSFGMTLDLSSNGGNHIITGTAGTSAGDTITTGSGNDQVRGGGGSDVINVGSGNDTAAWTDADVSSGVVDLIQGWAQNTADVLEFSSFGLTEGDGVGSAVSASIGTVDADSNLSNEASSVIRIAASAEANFSSGTSVTTASITAAIGEIVSAYSTTGDIGNNLKHILLMSDAGGDGTADIAVFQVEEADADGVIDANEVTAIAVLQDTGTGAFAADDITLA